MAFVGMFALGLFVGGVVTVGLKLSTSGVADFLKIMAAILTSALSGVTVQFINTYKSSDPRNLESFYMYPVGLLVALLWLYFDAIFRQTNPLIRWGGVISVVLITILATGLALIPAVRNFAG